VKPEARRGISSKHPGRADPDALARYGQLALPLLRRVWPWIFTGRNNLPTHDSYVVVANHSGLGTVESLLLPDVWAQHLGPDRPIAAMIHPAALRAPGLGRLMRSAGCVAATREGAAWARAHRIPLLLFPGGDHESMRPLWRSKEVDFGGRKGWIKLARDHRLTIVPMAITGSHVTAPTLGYSKALAYLSGARLLGVRRMPLSIAGIAAMIAGFFSASGQPVTKRALRALLAYDVCFSVPWVPSRLGFHLLPPLPPEALEAGDDIIYDRVGAAIGRVLAQPSVSR
jgi:1-acyl-sn-glycerol-3-phosphate acyltransferase